MVTRVFVDADVLFSRTLRDWLFLLKLESGAGMFTVATSLDVISEAIARYRDRHPHADGGVITRMFETIWESIDERVDKFTVGPFIGLDEGDAHVDAAAKACRADVLLTHDGGWHGLGQDQLDELPYEVQRPDDLFCVVDDSAPRFVEAVTLRQMKYWFAKNGQVDLPGRLRSAGCPGFAERVRCHAHEIDLSQLSR